MTTVRDDSDGCMVVYIIVALSMVLVVKLIYLRNGPVLNLLGLVFLDTMARLARN